MFNSFDKSACQMLFGLGDAVHCFLDDSIITELQSHKSMQMSLQVCRRQVFLFLIAASFFFQR